MNLVRFFIPLLIIIAIDTYAYQAFNTAIPSKWVKYIYWLINAMVYIFVLSALFIEFPTWSKLVRSYFIAIVFMLYTTKLLLCFFVVLDDIFRLGKWLWVSASNTADNTTKGFSFSRSVFLQRMGLIIGGIPFIAMLDGMIRNAYNYQVKKVNLAIPNLPSSLIGTKIVQISDLHTGSLLHKKPLKRAVNIINDQQADLVFFTGDLVNNAAKEAQSFIDIFKEIKAKHGVFSVLGNHDYGDYGRWPAGGKEANFELMKDTHQRMGWQLLLNDNKLVEIGEEKLAVIGVENWSNHPRYRSYGDLSTAYTADCEDCPVQLLLSHDPSHWRGEVLDKYPKINAVFSGHTHGFQFGINLPGIKWSPIQLAYDEWIGLYEQNQRYLYVNPGMGYVGYPGRVGFLPEITVFNLVQA